MEVNKHPIKLLMSAGDGHIDLLIIFLLTVIKRGYAVV